MNETEFAQNVVPFRDRMFRYARTLLLSDAEAEDVVHDQLEQLWLRRAALDTGRNIGSLIFTALRNRCYDLLRQRAVRRRRDGELAASGAHATTRAIDGWEARDWVRRAMEALPERQREVLGLRDIEGMPMEEIAAVTACSEAHVRVLLSRARRGLREELEKMECNERIRRTD